MYKKYNGLIKLDTKFAERRWNDKIKIYDQTTTDVQSARKIPGGVGRQQTPGGYFKHALVRNRHADTIVSRHCRYFAFGRRHRYYEYDAHDRNRTHA